MGIPWEREENLKSGTGKIANRERIDGKRMGPGIKFYIGTGKKWERKLIVTKNLLIDVKKHKKAKIKLSLNFLAITSM